MFLKYLAILMVVVMFVAIGATAYIYLNSNVEIVALNVQAINASDYRDLFLKNKEDIANETFEGTIFQNWELDDIENYTYLSYQIRLKNNTFLPIEGIEVQIFPRTGDVFQIGDFEYKTLQSKNSGDISATILTLKNTQTVREFLISYYVWGIPFTLRKTYG
ncbi:MAG: hypothetical protein GYA87_01075 [Christensenellaceae bacterium]|nr:hypothetical protein [Christensenellaceae bacterium]